MAPHIFAQRADQVGILGEALHQDLHRAVERGLCIRHAFVGVDESQGLAFRRARRVAQQQVGERFQPRFARDLGLGAALGLERQIEIFQPRLGIRRLDLLAHRRRQLALLVDALEDRGAAILHLAQVFEPLVERAQLYVVKPAGRLLAVARHERHRRSAIEQVDGGDDLRLAHVQFLRDAGSNGWNRQRNTCATERIMAALLAWHRVPLKAKGRLTAAAILSRRRRTRSSVRRKSQAVVS